MTERKINDGELAYIPFRSVNLSNPKVIDRPLKTSKEIYNESILDMAKIQEYAKYAAVNTKVPRKEEDIITTVIKRREINYGFLNLQTKTEEYQEDVKTHSTVDHWVLATKFWYHRQPTNEDGTEEETQNYSYCLSKDGNLFKRTVTSYLVREKHGPVLLNMTEKPVDTPLTEWEILNFDYDQLYIYGTGESTTFSNSDFDRGEELKYGQKGQGLLSLIAKLIL